MNGRVRFAEDFATRMFAVQGLPSAAMTAFCAGTSIAPAFPPTKARARMDADWRAMLTLMRELYPQDRMVRLAGVPTTTTATNPAWCGD